MALFKCKMCGGSLEINNNETVFDCEYCGSRQTLPRLDDEKKVSLYDRANHFRRNNDYDKAMGIYEQILNEDSSDAEAYWSLVLCKYGIEYVEDPTSHKRIPTVNRAQYTSIYDDVNYKAALEHADSLQKAVYEEEAKYINEIQKGILEISQNEEPFDVFICYKETDENGRRTQDSVLANDLYHQLTQEGLKVFFARITLEDKIGTAYEPYIFAALNSAKAMVVIGTKPEYFNAVWVKNEWSRYLALIKQGQKKILVPAYKEMDPYNLPEEFSHLQAQDMGKLGFMQDLIRGIKKIVQVEEEKVIVGTSSLRAATPLLERVYIFLEDGEWSSADEYCEKVLDLEPRNARAYLGKLMSSLHVRQKSDLSKMFFAFENDGNFIKAMRFADEELRRELQEIVDLVAYKNKDIIYNNALKQIDLAKTAKDYETIINELRCIDNYKDVQELIERCEKKKKDIHVLNYIISLRKKLNKAITEAEILNILKTIDNCDNNPELEKFIDECKSEHQLRRDVSIRLWKDYLSLKCNFDKYDDDINSLNNICNINQDELKELKIKKEHIVEKNSEINIVEAEIQSHKEAIEEIQLQMAQESRKIVVKHGIFGKAKINLNNADTKVLYQNDKVKAHQEELKWKMQKYDFLIKEIEKIGTEEEFGQRIILLEKSIEANKQQINELSNKRDEDAQRIKEIHNRLVSPKYLSILLGSEDDNLYFEVMTDLNINDIVRSDSKLLEIAQENRHYTELPIWVFSVINSKKGIDVEALYFQACEAMKNSSNDADILWAMEQFSTISGYKDSDDRMVECKKKIQHSVL